MQRAIVLGLVLLLSGCGFTLRGTGDLPPWLTNVAIVIKEEAHRDLLPLLKEELQVYGVRVNTNLSEARYLLIIEKDIHQQQITSVSASTTPRQYQLLYTVQYSLVEARGKPIVTSNVITVTRQLTVNNDRILGSDSEEFIIAGEMRRDAVMQILNRLSRMTSHAN